MNIDASQRGYIKMKIYLMDFSFCLVNFTLLKEPAEEKAEQIEHQKFQLPHM